MARAGRNRGGIELVEHEQDLGVGERFQSVERIAGSTINEFDRRVFTAPRVVCDLLACRPHERDRL